MKFATTSVIKTASSIGAKVSVDFASASLVKRHREEIERLLAANTVDLVFCNEDEALAYAGGVRGDLGAIEAAAEALAALARVVVVSLGARGCLAYQGERKRTARAKAPAITTVDTTGAGDFFTAGFLHSYLQGKGLSECCAVACRAGAAACLQIGTTVADKASFERVVFPSFST